MEKHWVTTILMKFMGGDQKMATNVPLSWTTEEDTTLIHYCNKIMDDSIAIDPPTFSCRIPLDLLEIYFSQ